MCIAVELEDSFDYADKIIIYNDGESSVYGVGSDEFDKILAGWKLMIKTAHDMPAFGVSLNSETLKAMNIGMWVEFDFGCAYKSNEMPYEKLLISVNKEAQGFNLIRYNSEGGYDGRCFYYDLVGKNMGNFYDILINL